MLWMFTSTTCGRKWIGTLKASSSTRFGTLAMSWGEEGQRDEKRRTTKGISRGGMDGFQGRGWVFGRTCVRADASAKRGKRFAEQLAALPGSDARLSASIEPDLDVFARNPWIG